MQPFAEKGIGRLKRGSKLEDALHGFEFASEVLVLGETPEVRVDAVVEVGVNWGAQKLEVRVMVEKPCQCLGMSDATGAAVSDNSLNPADEGPGWEGFA